MKTLDEVIKELQYWDTCHEYPECFYDDEVTRDALNYLKEYKRVQNKIEKIALGNIEDTLDKLDNKPLTWDELKHMTGKPVWVEEIEDDKILFGQWDIVSGFGYSENFDLIDYENPIIDFYRSGNRTKFGLCKSWQAYRKENNGR